MPKDNHSVMQLYLDGFKNNFYTFFYVHENKSEKLKNNLLLSELKFLKSKNISTLCMLRRKRRKKFLIQKIFHLEVLR